MTKFIEDMVIGDKGYTVGWSVRVQKGEFRILLGYMVENEGGGTLTAKVALTNDGYTAQLSSEDLERLNKMPEIQEWVESYPVTVL